MIKKMVFAFCISLLLSISLQKAAGEPVIESVSGSVTITKGAKTIISFEIPKTQGGDLKYESSLFNLVETGEYTITEKYILTLVNQTEEKLEFKSWQYEVKDTGSHQWSVSSSIINPVNISSWMWLKTSVMRPIKTYYDNNISYAIAQIGGRKKDAPKSPLSIPKGEIPIDLTGDIVGSVEFIKDKEVLHKIEIPKDEETSKIELAGGVPIETSGAYEIQEGMLLTIRALGLIGEFLKLRFDFPVTLPWKYEKQKVGARKFHLTGSVANVFTEVKGDFFNVKIDIPEPQISQGNPFLLPVAVLKDIPIGQSCEYSMDFSATWAKESFLEPVVGICDINIKVSEPPGAVDQIVSTNQIFTVTATVLSGTETGFLTLDGGKTYNPPPPKDKFENQFFGINEPVSWKVQAPREPTLPEGTDITVSIVGVECSKSINIVTVTPGKLKIEFSIVKPPGAQQNNAVSTDQEFTVQAKIIPEGQAKVNDQKATFHPPAGFGIKGDITQTVPETGPEKGIVKWTITAPKFETTSDFTITAEGVEENTGEKVEAPPVDKPLVVTVVSKADLSVNITEPTVQPGKFVQFATGQEFTVTAEVINKGKAGVTGKCSLKIDIGATKIILFSGEKEEKEFDLGKSEKVSVSWKLKAPSEPQSQKPITVSFGKLPLDENSGKPANVSKSSYQMQIETIQPLPIMITSPEGAKDGVVSTGQSFVVKAEKIPLDVTKATIYIPAGYRVDEQTKKPQQGIVTWQITTPPEDSPKASIKMDFEREGLGPLPSQPLSIETVTAASLSVSAEITEPEGAIDGTVSTRQTFTVTATLTKAGDAKMEGSGKLSIELPPDYIRASGEKEEIFDAASLLPIYWKVKAPDIAKGKIESITVKIEKAPLDKNTDEPAKTTVQTASVPINTVEEGGLKISSFDITSPTGAKDGIVSTQQKCSIQAIVIQTGVAKVKEESINIKLTLPTGYEAKEPTQDRLTWKWEITAPEIRDEKFQNLTVDVKGIEENTGETKSAQNSLPIRAESAVMLKIDVKSLNTVGGIVKVNTPFIVEAIVINEGDAKAEGKGYLKIDFGDTGVTLAKGEIDTKEFTVGAPVSWPVVAPSKPTDEGWITVSPTQPWSITDGNSGAPVPEPYPGKTSVKTIPENTLSATTRISEPPGATDGVVSTGQTFIVKTSVSVPPGVATPTSTIDVPNGYETLGLTSKEPVNNIVEWQVKAPPEPKAEQKITVVTKTTNPEQPQVENTISIKTVQSATLKISDLRIIDPKGATDKTLSDGQTFTVEATISKGGDAKIEGVGEIELSTKPPTYTIDGAIQRFPSFEESTTVKWLLKAPNWPTDRKGAITAEIKTAPQDENTNKSIKQELIGDPQSIDDVTIQQATELEITKLEITNPVEAKSGILHLEEKFTISATITKRGESGIDSTGRLVLTLPLGYRFTDENDKGVRSLELGIWEIVAPQQPDIKSQQIDLRINPIPNDLNTNAPAKVVSPVKGISVYTGGEDLVTIQLPYGEKLQAIVSTDQHFTVVDNVRTPVPGLKRTIRLPEDGGYTLDSPETQEVSQDGTVKWTVIAPKGHKDERQIQVFSGTEKFVGAIFITTVTKAQLYVFLLKIISPPGAIDQTVSTGQPFTVEAIVGKEGEAETIGTGELSIDAPGDNVQQAKKRFSVDEPVTWEVTALEEPVEKAPITVTITEPPMDENKWDKADIIEAGKSASIDIKIEPAATLELTDFQIADIQNNPILKGQLGVKQQFYVSLKVNWNETLAPSDAKISLNVPTNYIVDPNTAQERSLLETLLGIKKDEGKNEGVIKWTVTAPERPDEFIQQLNVKVSPSPLDRNTDFPARVIMPQPIPVQTGRGELIVKLTRPKIDAPDPDQPEKEGDPWNISTEQEFTVQAEIRPAGGVSPEQYHLKLELPPGFTTSEPLSKMPVKKDNKWYSEWIVTAPSNKITEDLVNITVTVEETGLSDAAKIRLQTKAKLGASQPQIIKPPKATNKENVVSTGQKFSVKTTVTKEGEADLEGGGVIKIEAEGYTLITTPEKTFLPDDFLEVEGLKTLEHQWDMIAPPNPNKVSSIRVTFSKLPNDDNTNKSIPQPEDKSIDIEVVQKAQVAIGKITFTPDGAADGVVSTEQTFTVYAPVTVSGTAKAIDIKATLSLPTGYTSPATLERNISTKGETVTWEVKAPSTKSDRQELKVQANCTDENGGESPADPPSTSSVTTVRQANVLVENVTVKGEGKKSGESVTQGKNLIVDVTLRNDGEATATVTGEPLDLRLEVDGKNVTNEYSVDLSKKQINPESEPLHFTLTPKKPKEQTAGTITINFNANNSTAWDENIGEEISVWDAKRKSASGTIEIVIPGPLAITQFASSSEKLLKDGKIELAMKIENKGETSARVTLSVPSDLVIKNEQDKDITAEFKLTFKDAPKETTKSFSIPVTKPTAEIIYEIEPIKDRDGEDITISIREKRPIAIDENSGDAIPIPFELQIPEILVDTVPPTIEEATIEARDTFENGILKGTDVLTIQFSEEIKEPQKVTLDDFKLPVTGDKWGAVKVVEKIDDKTLNIELRGLEIEVDSPLPPEQWTPEQWRKVREKSQPNYKLSKLDISQKGRDEIHDKAGNPADLGSVDIKFTDKWEPAIYHVLPPSKTTVSTSLTISAHIEDIRGRFSSGIDATTIKVIIEREGYIVEKIEYDEEENKISQYFRANTLQFPIQGLEDGTYDITINASDRQGNKDEATVSGITVRKSDTIILDLKSYPNPFDTRKALPSSLGDGCVFIVFSLREPASEVTFNIYDVAGELVWAAKMNQLGSTTAGIAWDGKTLLDDVVPAGVYYCELLVKNGDKEERRYWRMACRPTPKQGR
jgi:pimeloyl-CoA synthetase